MITALQNISPDEFDLTLYLYVDKMDLADQIPEYVHTIKEFDKTRYYRLPKSILLLFIIYITKLLRIQHAEKRYRQKLSEYIYQKRVAYPSKHALKNHKYDTVVSYSVHIGSEMALTIPADQHLLFVHSSDPYYHRDITSKVFDRYDHIVAVSDGVRQVIEEAFPKIKTKTTTLNNYVDGKDVIQKAETEFQEYDNVKKHGKRVICSCGRFSIEKGFDLAVKAARILRNRGLNFVWFFVGDGAERNRIERLIKENQLGDEIYITGFQSNPYPYIKHCDLYVQPSYEEAQPIVLLETKILGKAIVSTDTVGGRTILDNGRSGYLTEISAEGLANGVYSVLTNDGLLKSLEHIYTEEDNEKEREAYIEGWERLLSNSEE